MICCCKVTKKPFDCNMNKTSISLKTLLFGNSVFHNILYALIYILLFDYFWEHFEAVYFSYMGVIYVSQLQHRITGYLVALIPIFFYRGLNNASSWVSILVYYFGYVPMIMGLCLDIPLKTNININAYYVALCIAMSSFFLADRGKIKFKITSKKIKDNILWWITIVFTLVLFVTFAGNMRLANFTDIYQLREENAQEKMSLVGYIYGWCANYFYPFVFCYGIVKNQKKFIIVGICLFLFLFSIMGQKSDFFAPLILWVLYKIVIWQNKNNTNVMGPISLGILFLSVALLIGINKNVEGISEIAGLFFSRTLGVSAYHMPMYLNFFENNPYTYFSHINIVNAITHSYPYTQSIGEMVSDTDGMANAIFWLMDGVASCGVLGIYIISVIVYFFLLLLNGICNQKNKYFIYTMMLIPIVALVNVSFFTTVLSKGVLFLFLTVWFIDISFEPNTLIKYKKK